MSSLSSYDPQKNTVVEPSQEGSLETAIAGEYDFTVGEILSEAWQRIDGYKMPYAIITSVYFLIYIAAIVAAVIVFGKDTSASEAATQLVSLLLMPMSAALTMMGIHIAVGRPITVNMLFAYYDKLFPLIGLQIVMMLALVCGLLLFLIPGIYLSIALIFAVPLMIEKNLSIVDAFEASRKAVTHQWFTVFGTLFVMGLIVLVSALPFGLGLFWTMPMMTAVMGVMYRRMFGVSVQ